MRTTTALALVLSLAAGAAAAADPESCKDISLFDPGWTDINSTNAVATTILEALGYDPNVSTLSVAVGFEGMKSGDIDVFLGNWMPAQVEFRADLDAAKAVEVLTQNLAGAKFTLAVPSYVGIADFAELAPNAERFDSKILRHRPRHRRQQDHPGDDRSQRVRPRGLGARRDQRAGDARPGRPAPRSPRTPSSSSPGRRTR